MLRDWLGCLAAVLCSAPSVHAADLESAWHAPSLCPSAQQADERLRERTRGLSPLSAGTAEVWIDHAPSGALRARITLMDSEGREQRVLYGRDCEALSDAVLLVISMASETDHADPRPSDVPPEREPDVRETSTVRDTQGPPVEPLRVERTSPFISTRLGIAAAVDRGSLPETSFAGRGVITLGGRRLQGSLSASYFARKQVHFADGVSAEFGLISGELGACYMALGNPFEAPRSQGGRGYALGPCLGLELGLQRGQGMGLKHAAMRTGLWAASLLGVGLALGPFGRVVPTGSLSLGVAVRRPRFEVEEAGLVFQAKPVFMRATLGLMIELNP